MSMQTYRPYDSVDKLEFLFQIPAGYYESAAACFSEINQAIVRCFSPIPQIREERPFSDALKRILYMIQS